MSRFARDWLRLRESADLAARDPGLARRFGAFFGTKPDKELRILDLGAGSGANCRALLSRFRGNQEWILVDRDRDLIAAQGAEFTLWARRQGYPILAGGGQMTIAAGAANWRVRGMPLDLARDPEALDTLDAAGVSAAAFFDLVSAAWIERFTTLLARRRLPLLAALTVDGGRVWEPALAEDGVVGAGFRHHQQSDKGFGPALGGAAPQTLARALAAKGFTVAEAASDWRLGNRDRALLAELVAGEAQAAAASMPEQTAAIAAWGAARRVQLQEGKLKLTVSHRDMLALPV